VGKMNVRNENSMAKIRMLTVFLWRENILAEADVEAGRVGRLHLPTRMWQCIRGHALLCPPYNNCVACGGKLHAK
jgi:hypothetical protein